MFGVDYYPEHWDSKRLKSDLKIIKENGMEVIRIGEFIWSDVEPEEGRYAASRTREQIIRAPVHRRLPVW